MSNKPASPRPLTLVERIEQIEKVLPRINEIGLNRTNIVAKQFGDAVGNLVEIVQAVIRLQGEGFDTRVEEEVMAGRRRRAEEELAQAKAVLENLIATKALIPSETVTEQCVIVGKDFDKDGNVAGLGRVQVQFNQLPEPLQKDFLGKPAGFKYTNENGAFEIQEVYVSNPNPPAPEAAPEAPIEAPATEGEQQSE